MKINFLDLKELSGYDNEALPIAPPVLDASIGREAKILAEYMIEKMFALHMQASQTLWDRKMFDDEIKRKGSGFIICYSKNADKNAMIADAGANGGKFTASDIDPSMKCDLQSDIIGFFIFYNVMDEMHILDLTVAKDMRHKGIGSSILDYAVKKYSPDIIKYFFLEVRVSNSTAIKLYEKFGFKIFMLRKAYYEDNGEDALCMVKEL